MGEPLEKQIENVPVVRWLVLLLKRIQIKALAGLSLFDLIALYVRGIIRGALSTRASAIAFSLFMAIFPLLIFLLTLIPYVIPYVSVGNSNFDAQFLAFMETFLPTSTSEYFEGVYHHIREQKRGGWLSSAFLISILLMTNGVNAIFGGFETSYHIELTRKFFKQYAYALMVGLILSLLLILGAVVYVYFEFYVLGFLTDFTARSGGVVLDEGEIIGAQIAKALFFVLLTYLSTAILYYFGTHEGKHANFFSYGALMTTLLILLTSYLFGIYIDTFARYNELYGALSGLLILMIYIWLNANILLLGFELNATLSYLRRNMREEGGEP